MHMNLSAEEVENPLLGSSSSTSSSDKTTSVSCFPHRTMDKIGFELWVPPTATKFEDGMPYYEIIGFDAQFVQFPLKAGHSVTCFAGAMAYMSPEVKMEVKLAGFGKTFGRLAGGGSLFQTTYTNESDEDGYVSMTPDYPGIVVPVDMRVHPSVVALRDSYLCSTVNERGEETQVGADVFRPDSVLAFCCAGFDFIVQTVREGEWAFLVAMGTVVTKTLTDGERMLVDSNAILCFESSVDVDVKRVGGLAAMCCAGSGLFHTELTGPGKVWLQSMSIDKLRSLIQQAAAGSGGDGGGDGGGD